MATYNSDRAAGYVIACNSVMKAVSYVDKHQRIPATASYHVRRVLRVIYGKKLYRAYRTGRPKMG